MKKVEKQDLIKWASIVMFIAVILSWIIGQSQIIDGVLTTDEINRVGIFQLAYYFLEGFGYVSQLIPLVFIVPGFYAVLGSTEVYAKLTDVLAFRFGKKKKLFVAISMLLYACLAGISSNYLALIALVPFTISILAKMKVDKITGMMASIGGILIGILGATYAPGMLEVVTLSDYGIGLSYGFELVGAIVLFVLAYVLLVHFTFSRMDKNIEQDEKQLLVDPYASYEAKEVVDKKGKKKSEAKVNLVPLIVTLLITFIIVVLAFIGWDTAFNVSLFNDMYEWLIEATLFGKPIYSYILGIQVVSYYGAQTVFSAFGNWDLLQLSMLLMLVLLIIKILYRIPLDELISKFIEGIKSSIKTIIILTIIYVTVYISVQYHSVIPYFIDKIVDGASNVFTAFISGGLMSIFSSEFSLVIRSIGSLFTAFKNLDVVILALQAAHGFVSFFAPTSVVLMIGLSTFNIEYKEYFKFIWKFLVALLVIILIVLAILSYL